MGDGKGPFGIYFTNPPSKPKPPNWRGYILDYIVPGLIVLGGLRLLALVLSWFV